MLRRGGIKAESRRSMKELYCVMREFRTLLMNFDDDKHHFNGLCCADNTFVLAGKPIYMH